MAAKYQATDYMYGSARVRALETKIVGRERIERMLEARSSGEILASLGEHGFEVVRNEAGEILREETLMSALVLAYAELDAIEGARKVTEFLRYPTDCNNVKAQIKCFSRGLDARPLMIDGIGTLTAERIETAFRDKDYGDFPKNMAEAIPACEEDFAKTKNPQVVDLMIDRACYADMLASAKESGVAFAVRLVETKIDLQNIVTCLRLLRMSLGASGEPMLASAFLEGGDVEKSLLTEALSEGESWLSERLLYTRYSALLSGDDKLTLDEWAKVTITQFEARN